jgi:hypothetical protein
MKPRVLAQAILCMGALTATLHAGFAPSLRVDPASSALILRMCLAHDLTPPRGFWSQPMDAGSVLAFLDKVDSLGHAGVLSAQESYDVQGLRTLIVGRRRASFIDTTHDRSIRGRAAGSGWIAPTYDGEGGVHVRGIIQPTLSGNLGALSFYSGVEVWTDYVSDSMYRASNYEPYDGVPYNLYGSRGTDSAHARSSDLFRAGIAYRGKRLDLESGVDYLRQGPAVFYPLSFSGYAPPITYGRVRMDLGVLDYVQAFGILRSQRDKLKFLYTHRLELPLLRQRATFGFSEMIVGGSTTNQQLPGSPDALRPQYYGERRLVEWAYLIPFVPSKFVEHYVGDRDNGLISADLEVRWPRHLRWYGEFLIDDILSPWKIFTDDWGNKWGFTLGGQFMGTLLHHDVSATVEYSRVEPWVYTHFYGGSHRYDNFNVCLGSPLGPNSDGLVLDFGTSLTKKNSVGIRFTNERRNPSARGGTITDVFQDSLYVYKDSTYVSTHPDSEHKRFLGPGAIRSSRIGAWWKFSPFGGIYMTARCEYDFSPDVKALFVYYEVGGRL